jgi:hypothetical protein
MRRARGWPAWMRRTPARWHPPPPAARPARPPRLWQRFDSEVNGLISKMNPQLLKKCSVMSCNTCGVPQLPAHVRSHRRHEACRLAGQLASRRRKPLRSSARGYGERESVLPSARSVTAAYLRGQSNVNAFYTVCASRSSVGPIWLRVSWVREEGCGVYRGTDRA